MRFRNGNHVLNIIAYHENHLNELRGVVGETAAEPEKRKHTSQPDVGREHLADRHARVAAVVRKIVGDVDE